MGGKNIGDLLNAAGVTWGSFMGGFNLNINNPQRHHWLQPKLDRTCGDDETITFRTIRFSSTMRPPPIRNTRARNQSLKSEITVPPTTSTTSDDFFAAVQAGNFPAVNFLKAPAYQDGHAGYSDPLDEQALHRQAPSTSSKSSENGTAPPW